MRPLQSCEEDEAGVAAVVHEAAEEEAEDEAHCLELPCRPCQQLPKHHRLQGEVAAGGEAVVQEGEVAEVVENLLLKASRFMKSAPTATTICLMMLKEHR